MYVVIGGPLGENINGQLVCGAEPAKLTSTTFTADGFQQWSGTGYGKTLWPRCSVYSLVMKQPKTRQESTMKRPCPLFSCNAILFLNIQA